MLFSRLVYGMVVLSLFLSVALPDAAGTIVFAAAIGGIVLIRHRAIELPALFLLVIPGMLVTSDGIAWGRLHQQAMAAGVGLKASAAPGMVTVPALIALMSVVVVGIQVAAGRIPDHVPKWWVICWAAGTVLGAGSAYAGYVASHAGWSAPLRISGIFAIFLWAVSLSDWSARSVVALDRGALVAVWVSAGGLLLGVGTGNGVYLMSALAAGGGTAMWHSRRRAAAWFLWIVAGANALLHTFTVLGIVGFTILLGSIRGRRGLGSALQSRCVAAALVGGLILLCVALLGSPSTVETGAPVGSLYEKVFEDRGTLWQATVAAIAHRPAVLAPATQDLYIFNYPNPNIAAYQLWRSGPHQGLLELGLQFGFVGGLPFAALLISALLRVTHAAGRVRRPVLSKTMYGFIAVSTVGLATGHFLVRETAGIAIMTILGAGLSLAASLGLNSVSRPCGNRNLSTTNGSTRSRFLS